LDAKKCKSLRLQGASPPDPLTRGSAPGPRWGHSPQAPVIGSRYRARHVSEPSHFSLRSDAYTRHSRFWSDLLFTAGRKHLSFFS